MDVILDGSAGIDGKFAGAGQRELKIAAELWGKRGESGVERRKRRFLAIGSASVGVAVLAGCGFELRKAPTFAFKSLSLPALGQTTSNAATTVLSAEGNESGWGWLVDEVAKSSGGTARAPEEALTEAEEFNPFLRDRAASLAQTGNAEALPNASFPDERAVQDRNSPNRNALSGTEPGRPGRSGQALADFSAPKDYRASTAAAGGMSQTRELIAGFSGVARPDFASLRESLAGAAAKPSDGEKIVPSNLGADLSSSESRLSAGSGGQPLSGGLPTRSGAGASWQGGWNAARVDASVLPRLETPIATTIPASTPVSASRPGFSSGGYKPAWY